MRTAGRYLLAVTVLNLVWEVAQLPLYTIWTTGSARDNLFAVLHCTVGDAMIATIALATALVVCRAKNWPSHRFLAVALIAIIFGLGYTIYSEWRNTSVTMSWAYADAMPRLLGVGLSPIAQWLVVPGVVFWWMRRSTAS
ncbi:MAG: hypothetical protein KIT63_24020 [Rhodoferax sp.]|nr:hypothetical protein [Rhodoferax sp.]